MLTVPQAQTGNRRRVGCPTDSRCTAGPLVSSGSIGSLRGATGNDVNVPCLGCNFDVGDELGYTWLIKQAVQRRAQASWAWTVRAKITGSDCVKALEKDNSFSSFIFVRSQICWKSGRPFLTNLISFLTLAKWLSGVQPYRELKCFLLPLCHFVRTATFHFRMKMYVIVFSFENHLN